MGMGTFALGEPRHGHFKPFLIPLDTTQMVVGSLAGNSFFVDLAWACGFCFLLDASRLATLQAGPRVPSVKSVMSVRSVLSVPQRVQGRGGVPASAFSLGFGQKKARRLVCETNRRVKKNSRHRATLP